MAPIILCTLITTFLVAGCVDVTDPIDRPQNVYHYICPDDAFHLWFPENTLGIAYSKDEYVVGEIPRGCKRKELGIVNNIGDLPK